MLEYGVHVSKKQKIIIFDGICTLCNNSIDMLMRIDEEKMFKYTSLQGEYAKKLAIPEDMVSVIFYDEDRLYYKSTAILKILRSLGGLWVFTNIFYIIPTFIRDFIYDVIAKYRYKIFGKMQSCRMPKVGEKALFID